ncbi:hypothetical protein GO684_01425 [Wolbachia endosymbiont of Litomosoides brasiliensis]|uniref:hypothetical protein n=1 Tax=Wolbachia endosymbiont of Litomosoides brasiliensis TaxID=1812117 RepID=UPI00158CF3E9|nr:hypothetical protein [Wolbachia endosymbiont of Litomosoides brasiliensis]NUY39366.1 hypothetical protein [Wolbachia endosymbiont of Litomosoides brasiliensis]
MFIVVVFFDASSIVGNAKSGDKASSKMSAKLSILNILTCVNATIQETDKQ